ncbi:MAG: Rne/Rng family ribonuclease [Polymorphobacter sp.]|uniref:Rne/Rng family ribonuclease n=1 Tax=Polymorphobacter sp. TaxID=1909290 RepID=UPI003A8AE0A5
MSHRMLIDARHREETRVAVVNGQRIEEFDFEAADRRQLKGNIYLAKVTRVEPSLQAAFIEYGGNRHGFLAFSEIHPDYYQIPREDREALLREEAELAAEQDELGDEDDDREDRRDDGRDDDRDDDDGERDERGEDGDDEGRIAETGGKQDEPSDVLRRKRQSLRRRYKIQEVIRRRQVLLIQVVKEERGSKGAALTTYLSLAGRYCVLMPNTAHGGGISRKIANPADRRRLKTIMADLQLPDGMGAIVRTAGLKRSAAEIRRDFDYLTRLWDEIRERTLGSTAPALIHQDSDLIKRAIRDVYNRHIEQILVEGREGHEAASRFMSMLMPGHAAKVVEYQDNVPLFQRFGVEQQLEGMYQPVVQLKSGGYIVINPTEALVSIDINSGRSTREYGIEETATKTNLEAAEEIGRQLRLRDMAGLVVIDFIDMENNSNIRRVEKAMKEAMKNDRARVQIGRISSFGLLEMSRQRLRTGVLEASTHSCPMCEGTGMVRSVASAALAALRELEAEALRGRANDFTLRASEAVAVYILNKKRVELADLEKLYGVTIHTVPDDDLIGANFTIDAAGPAPTRKVEMKPLPPVVRIEDDADDEEDDDRDADGEDDGESDDGGDRRERGRGKDRGRERGSDRDRGKSRRRRRDREPAPASDGEDMAEADGEASAAPEADGAEGGTDEERASNDRKRRRRGRRGRRGGARENGAENGAQNETGEESGEAADAVSEAVSEEGAEPTPKPRRRRAKAAPAEATAEAPVDATGEATSEATATSDQPEAVDADAPKPRTRRRASKAAAAETVDAPATVAAEAEAPKPRTRRKPKAEAPAEAEALAEVVAEAPVEAAASADVSEAPKPSRSRKPKKAEPAPVAEADGTDAAPEASAGPAPAPRKGWWQRTFG